MDFWMVVHNLIAHPLLVLCPPLGEWLHDRTVPAGEREEVSYDMPARYARPNIDPLPWSIPFTPPCVTVSLDDEDEDWATGPGLYL